ncbi:DUF4145 domain-containing protein [Cyclobacterium marinum]|uniref:Uncharacterized protein n=1 Tax=Cyclobacterium marinum (strain ATCC 25205 / DSM 745 / LMG 13164 / NCIMB 1802) TaxID=880070 RepID=G0J3Y1_CYCMS|nr:DUF4145 domain-containing protein [Cyclobacterium marinum]AEL25955.1 hypothetical protein Cycma_2213 [Cyclobacterium marinum DSM 745]MBR9777015.1 DUF4145 domain-containing protein [Cytophagales bacterium]|tara:strand:- start:60 stop:593 length:534 start_codon:yes stop_codon:yes gene_type:complete
MIEYLKLIVEVIGHIIWPLSFVIIFLIFRKEIKSLIKRLKSAEIKDFKIELEDKIEDIKKDAINYGVTMAYPREALENEFNPTKQLPKSYVIIETWNEIELLIRKLDDREKYNNISDSINYLSKNHKIQKYLASMILDLRELRNIAVHKSELSITEEDYQNWISISKSVIDRLKSNR